MEYSVVTRDFSHCHLGVDGDSITQGSQWSAVVSRILGVASHHNVGVGSAVWYKRTLETGGGSVTTQNFTDPDFAGISDGWLPTDDPVELQKRANNCAVVHVQKFIEEVRLHQYAAPDIFMFAMGTNDAEDCLGSPEKALEGKTADAADLFTEAGAARWCIQRILEEYPDCRVFVMLPIQTACPEHNAKLEKTAAVLTAVAHGMSVQVMDCLHGSGICEKFEVPDGAGRYLRDGLHPTPKGQELMGRFAAKELRNNMF